MQGQISSSGTPVMDSEYRLARPALNSISAPVVLAGRPFNSDTGCRLYDGVPRDVCEAVPDCVVPYRLARSEPRLYQHVQCGQCILPMPTTSHAFFSTSIQPRFYWLRGQRVLAGCAH